MTVKTKSEGRIEIRPVRISDVDQIVELYNIAPITKKTAPLTADIWKWKYLESPVAKPELSFVALEKNGRMIGHLGSRLVRLNALGKQGLIGHCLDSIALPGYRQDEILSRIFPGCFKTMKDAGLKAAIAAPAGQEISVYQDRSTFLFPMARKELEIKSGAHLKLKEWCSAIDRDFYFTFDLNVNYGLETKLDEMLETCRARELLSVWKDVKYYDWKYRRSPRKNRYRFFALEIPRVLCGAFAVVLESDERAEIVEVQSLNKDVLYARELVLGISDHYAAASPRIRSLIFRGKDHWYYDGVFNEFELLSSFDHPVFSRAIEPDESFVFENASNWTITFSDMDSV